MFDMPDGQEIDEPDIHKISEDLEVTVSIKPKIRQDAKSVLIKSQERHASAMYEARHRLLKIDDDEEDLVKAEVPEAYKIQPITAQTLSNIGKFSTLFFTSLIVARPAHLCYFNTFIPISNFRIIFTKNLCVMNFTKKFREIIFTKKFILCD